MSVDLFFPLALSLLCCHELDAMRCKEWRLLPGLSRLSEDTGQAVFLWIHIPLFGLIFWAAFGPDGWNQSVVWGLDVFCMVHVLAHLALTRHPENEFRDLISWVFIGGAGLMGALHLASTFL